MANYRPTIYIYNCDQYNQNLFPVYINPNDVIYDKNNTSQYSLEIKIHELIKNYDNLTDDINQCDMIYMPVYLFLLAWKTPYCFNPGKTQQTINELKQFIDEYSLTKKILLVYSDVMWECDFCFINKVKFNKNVYVVCYESVLTSLNNQIAVPFVTHINYDHRTYQIPFITNKQNLICYCGRPRKEQNYIKNMVIIDLMKYQQKKNVWISCNDMRMYLEIDDLYMNSTFSLQPHGDKETRKGFYHSILLGCIPVIFENNTNMYSKVFGDYVNINDICIIIKNDEIDKIEEILLAQCHDKLCNMIMNYDKIKHIMMYDMSNMDILYNIFNKMTD